MSERPQPVPAGTRVQVKLQLLAPGERFPGLPSDTAKVPYEARVRGILVHRCLPGEQASVRTQAGRELRGVLEAVEPVDSHSFSKPHPALLQAVEHIMGLQEELR